MNESEIRDYLNKTRAMTNSDLEPVFREFGEKVKEIATHDFITHENKCQDGCQICAFKEDMESQSYLKGVEHGMKITQDAFAKKYGVAINAENTS